MIFAVWTLLAAITCCHHVRSSPVPPVVDALEPSSQEFAQTQDEALASPDKRLLKYFLPDEQSWGEGAPIPTSQEGIKRGYSDKNYLRFGRNENRMPNFIRFGRSGLDDYDEELEDSMDKRGRNFLRFGRGPNNNFLRFGRAKNSNYIRYGRSVSPLEYALGIESPEEDFNEMPIEQEKRSRGYVRFGRSVDNQLSFCENCDDNQASKQTTTVQPATTHAVVTRPKRSAAKEPVALQRTKRFVPTYYGYAMSHSPAAWARSVPSDALVLDEEASEYVPVKRGNVADSGMLMVKQYPRFVRAPQRNFLRFG